MNINQLQADATRNSQMRSNAEEHLYANGYGDNMSGYLCLLYDEATMKLCSMRQEFYNHLLFGVSVPESYWSNLDACIQEYNEAYSTLAMVVGKE